MVVQLVKKFRHIQNPKVHCHLLVPRTTHHASLKSTLILYSHQCLCLSNSLFHKVLDKNIIIIPPHFSVIGNVIKIPIRKMCLHDI